MSLDSAISWSTLMITVYRRTRGFTLSVRLAPANFLRIYKNVKLHWFWLYTSVIS